MEVIEEVALNFTSSRYLWLSWFLSLCLRLESGQDQIEDQEIEMLKSSLKQEVKEN